MLGLQGLTLFKHSNSDQHQISPSNINAYKISTPEVIRNKDIIITQGEFC